MDRTDASRYLQDLRQRGERRILAFPDAKFRGQGKELSGQQSLAVFGDSVTPLPQSLILLPGAYTVIVGERDHNTFVNVSEHEHVLEHAVLAGDVLEWLETIESYLDDFEGDDDQLVVLLSLAPVADMEWRFLPEFADVDAGLRFDALGDIQHVRGDDAEVWPRVEALATVGARDALREEALAADCDDGWGTRVAFMVAIVALLVVLLAFGVWRGYCWFSDYGA